ncbi:MAG: hypothetical protein WA709_14910, partial [Stellaceae bacterium]
PPLGRFGEEPEVRRLALRAAIPIHEDQDLDLAEPVGKVAAAALGPRLGPKPGGLDHRSPSIAASHRRRAQLAFAAEFLAFFASRRAAGGAGGRARGFGEAMRPTPAD